MERDALVQVMVENIQLLMEERGWKPADLQRAAGYRETQSGVYDILQGRSKNPRLDTLNKIANALQVPLAHLLEPRMEASLNDEILSIYTQLDPEDRHRLLQTGRAWLPAASA